MALLTLKQQGFINAYLSHGNATQACREAGYSGNENTLAVQGHENLRNPKIAEAIARRTRQHEAQADVSRVWALERLKSIAESDSSQSVSALRLIADMEGWITRKQEVTGQVEHVTAAFASLSNEEFGGDHPRGQVEGASQGERVRHQGRRQGVA